MMKRFILTSMTAFLFSFYSSAEYKMTCGAKYLGKDNWSTEYKVNITFISGSELNQATHKFDYTPSGVYALIFWEDNQTLVIELSTPMGRGGKVDKNCITSNPFFRFEGRDKADVLWVIYPNRYVN